MADYIEGKAISEVYDDHSARYANSQRKQQAARDLLAGKMKAPLDESILPGSADREHLRSSIPEKYVVPIKTEAMLSEKEIRLKRFPVGIGQRAMTTATKIEQIDNALAGLCYPDAPVTDNLLQEGAAIVVTQPMTSFWAAAPDSMYEDDEMTTVKKRYAVDKDGRSEDDDYYTEPGSSRKFRANDKESSKYFDSVRKDYYARNVPIEMRALSCREAVVLYPRRKGSRMIVDGLVRKSEWSLSSLVKAGYRWGRDAHMEPSGAANDRNRTMFEYIGTNAAGHVYFSYSVDGEETTKNGKSAVIDLTETLGIEQLPIAFDYGMNFAGEIDADLRPIPFVDLFARSWMNQDSALTSMLVRFYKVANLYMTYEPNADLLKVLGITGDVPMPEMRPGFIVPVLGKLQDPNSTVNLREFSDVISILRSVTQEHEISGAATGTGDSQVAGYAQNVALARALGTFTQVRSGQQSIKEQAIAHANEQMACIGKKRRPVCLFVNQEIPVEQRSGQQSSTRAIIEVDPELFGDVWDVTAEVPQDIEDNMALAQVLSEHHDRGKIPHEWLLEKGYGDPSPDVTLAKIRAEAAMNTPLGMARLNTMAAQIAGDDELEAIMKGLAAQELLKLMPADPATPDNVVPSSIGAGLQPPHMTGMVAPNPVESQVGGIMGGAMNGQPGAREPMGV